MFVEGWSRTHFIPHLSSPFVDTRSLRPPIGVWVGLVTNGGERVVDKRSFSVFVTETKTGGTRPTRPPRLIVTSPSDTPSPSLGCQTWGTGSLRPCTVSFLTGDVSHPGTTRLPSVRPVLIKVPYPNSWRGDNHGDFETTTSLRFKEVVRVSRIISEINLRTLLSHPPSLRPSHPLFVLVLWPRYIVKRSPSFKENVRPSSFPTPFSLPVKRGSLFTKHPKTRVLDPDEKEKLLKIECKIFNSSWTSNNCRIFCVPSFSFSFFQWT